MTMNEGPVDSYLSADEEAYFKNRGSEDSENKVVEEFSDEHIERPDKPDLERNAESADRASPSEDSGSEPETLSDTESTDADDEASDSDESGPKSRDYEKAFKTERHKRKELKEALEETNRKAADMEARIEQLKASMLNMPKPEPIKAPAPEVVPDEDDDPIGYMQYKTKKLEAHLAQQSHYLQSQYQAQQAQLQDDAFIADYRARAVEFAKKTPDFGKAYEFLIASKLAEYEAAGFNAQQAQDLLKEDERATVAIARQAGVNPAERIYNVAKSRGYNTKSSVKAPPKNLADIKKGLDNSKSLKPGGGDTLEREVGMADVDGMNWNEFDDFFNAMKQKSKRFG